MRSIVTTISLLCLASLVNAATITGTVVGISDGDTFTLLTESQSEVKIRIAEIDSPESGQPYGSKSKQALSSLIFGKQARIEVHAKDRFGRTVGHPYIGDIDICVEMVRIGAAWVYRKYVIDQSLFDVEAEAKESKRGLWGLPEVQRIEPWNWRRGLSSGGEAPEGCVIKGNVTSKGDKIYHVPGTSSYGATRIDESKGERWFCSEQEAVSEGWRALSPQ